MHFGAHVFVFLTMVCFCGLSSLSAIAGPADEDFEAIPYRFKSGLSVATASGSQFIFTKGKVVWLESTSDDGEIFYLRDPNGNARTLYPVRKADFERVLQPSYQVTRFIRGFTTDQGIVIKPGTTVIEHSFGNDSVNVTIEGDTSGAVYEVPKSAYRANGATQELERAPVVPPPSTQQDHELYQIRTKFTGLPGVLKGQAAIDLNSGDEVEVVGEGTGGMSWASKVKIVKGPSAGKEFYISDRLLRDPRSATNLTDEDVVPRPKAKKSPQVDIAPRAKPVNEDDLKPQLVTPKIAHQTPGARSNFEGLKSVGGVALDPVSDPADCMPRQGHRRRSTAHLTKKRMAYRNYILRAANAYDIPPAVLEASIHLETDMNEESENLGEKKEAIEKYGSERAATKALTTGTLSDTWGKGFCQFGPSDSHDFKIDWTAPKPKKFPVDAKYRRDNPNSVWDPEACLMAKARYMRSFYDRKTYLNLANGKQINLRDYFFNRGPDKAAAAYLTFFNRASRYRNSLQAYYSRHGKLPEEFGQAWEEPACTTAKCKPPQSRGTLVLKGQHIARVHVLNGAGLCSGAASKNSFYSVYAQDYKQVKDAKGNLKWVNR